MAHIRDNVVGPSSTVVMRTTLRQRIQQPDESVEAFVADLRRLAGDCQEGEQLVRDQLARGLQDSTLCQRLAERPGSTTIADILHLTQEARNEMTDTHLYAPVSTTNRRRLNVGSTTRSPLEPLATVQSLPPELLIIIFKVLDIRGKRRAAQVCRKWRDLAESASVWCNTRVEVRLGFLYQPTFTQLAHRGVRQIKIIFNLSTPHIIPKWQPLQPDMLSSLPHLTHLNISFGDTISDKAIHQISTSLKMLVSLEIYGYSMFKMTNASLASLCQGLKKLERLTLALGGSNVTDAGMQQLAHSDLPLRYLALRDCESLTDATFRYLSEGKPGLEGLDILICPALTDTGFKYMATMKGLLHLKIKMLFLVKNNFQLNMIASMKSLRSLELSWNLVNVAGFEILTKGSSPIEKLVLNYCLNLTDASMEHLSTMPCLRQLKIRNCKELTLKGLETLLRRNGNLTSLDISYSGSIGLRALQHIVATQPNLQWLRISNWQMDEQVVKLEEVVRQLKRLRVLYVDDEIRISGGCVIPKRR